MSIAVDPNQTARFLAELDLTTTAWTFQTFDDGPNRRPNLARSLHGTFQQHASDLTRLSAQGAGIFITVNETDGSGRRKATNIRRVRALFADFDSPAPDILERLRADVMPPSMIVESSAGKFHAYWLVDGVALEEFTALQRAIAHCWGSDPAVSDRARVMRLPGFPHQKGEPQAVLLLEVTGRRYGEELANRYRSITPATKEPEWPPVGGQLAQDSVLGAYAAAALEHACHAVAAAMEGCRNEILNAQAFGIGQLVAGGEISEARAWGALRAAAMSTGLSHAEAAATLLSAFRAAAKQPRTAPTVDADSLLDDLDDEPPLRRNLTQVALSNLMVATIPSVCFIFQPLFPRRHVTLLAAHGGTGKSSLAIILAAHVACGRSWAGFPAEPGRALLVSLEDDGDVCRGRLRAAVLSYGLDPEAVARGMVILDGTEGEAALMTESEYSGRAIPTACLRELSEVARDFDLILIDNASDAFDANENSRRDVRAFLRALARIARSSEAAVVLLAHIDKAAARDGAHGNSYSGSTAWHNSARSRLALVADEAGIVTLTQEKLNLGKKADPVSLAFTVGHVLMPLALIDERDDERDVRDVQAAQDAHAVYDLLALAIEADITIPVASSGPTTAWHVLAALPEMGKVWRTKDGKRRFQAALVRLQREGRIIKEAYSKPNRHTGERWKLASMTYAPVGENSQEKGDKVRANISPIPPSATGALGERRANARVGARHQTGATDADADFDDLI
ncbi:AAA family ATPase [Vogesella sp. AC12]|uniref:AAA family ATPase n=1 Tax=Vogesella sp. AC12 TaxID=2950550 RepID=UPI002108EB78|nr:AAA family ATPase [Vogesella sp. AC12]MCQ4145807.1 AAA family ATPase [Vogesella sp. AC12]